MASEWNQLFNGIDLTGWRMRHPDREHKWVARDGILDNTGKGVDIITEDEFGDFELHIEYLVPKDSNSGIYLRGRYELQILDSLGKTYSYPAENGALYNQKHVDVEASKPAREWQTIDITLKGMTLTAILNGKTIHDNVVINGPTGGQLGDDNPPKGPLMLQGDHGAVQFRTIRIREL
ncbi:MAG: DUF1080 domain-containing protein [Candidatus Poribacteria bacterium]|nr:DUF1080 domain-containing protein [Candidatus Poribacteria bacterium]